MIPIFVLSSNHNPIAAKHPFLFPQMRIPSVIATCFIHSPHLSHNALLTLPLPPYSILKTPRLNSHILILRRRRLFPNHGPSSRYIHQPIISIPQPIVILITSIRLLSSFTPPFSP